jgi:tyrosine-protein phosphatase
MLIAVSDSSASTSATSDSDYPLFSAPPSSSRSLRNMKKLSLSLHSAQSSASSLLMPSSETPGISNLVHPVPPSAERPRRLSVASLPNASVNTLLHRKEDEGSPTIPYFDGPVQIIPGVWLGSEDNARDWKGLVERGIRSILNVAKEVVSPFDSARPVKPFASTPDLKESAKERTTTSYPAHLPSGRPSMHYLKLQWSHGQQDLVHKGFPAAMTFTDAALSRGDGVLIQCVLQFVVLFFVNLIIAFQLSMWHFSLSDYGYRSCNASGRTSFNFGSSRGVGIERYAGCICICQRKKQVGRTQHVVRTKNISFVLVPSHLLLRLIYQLLEYERALQAQDALRAPSEKNSVLDEEEEWGRRRRLLDEAPSDHDDDERESVEVMREARALDKAMEDRIVARKASASSIASSSGVGMGPAWRSRYGARKRTASIASNKTTGSILSEDLVEEEEEQELLGVGGGFDDNSIRHASPSTDFSTSASPESQIDSPDPIPDLAISRPVRSHVLCHPPPSAPVWKTSFNVAQPPATAVKSSFDMPTPPSKFLRKNRTSPKSGLPCIPSSPISANADPVDPAVTRSQKRVPPPLHLRKPARTSSIGYSQQVHTSTPSQTFFVFPPSPTLTTRVPSTMTLTSNMNVSLPFPSSSTPRVSTFRSHGRTKSFIGLGVPPTPTTACSRVDARGWVGLDVSS